MEFSGIIHHIAEIVHVSATFKKREVVLEVSETKGDRTFTELITFQFVQDKTFLLDDHKEGDSIMVGFNLKGRAWQSPQGDTRYFNTLQAWMIRGEDKGPMNAPQAEIPQAAPSPSKMAELPKVEMPKFDGESEDDIPF